MHAVCTHGKKKVWTSDVQVRHDIIMSARTIIMSRLRAHGNLSEVARIVGISRSLLYQFARPGGPHLGAGVVSRMRCRLPEVADIDDPTWMEAMGVDYDCEVTDAP
jgi:hypothetical protein